MATTSTSVAGLALDSYVFNASGPNDETLEKCQILGKSGAAAITMKTCTLDPREGNPEPRYKDVDLGSINSMGLPNLGYQEYLSIATQLKEEFQKPVVASLAGMQPDDFPKITEAFQDSDVDIIEINLSCPNLPGKPQIGYDYEQTDHLLSEVCSLGDKPITVKLPPYFDFVHFEMAADVLNRHPIKAVVCINSIGNGLIIDPETESVLIKPKGGFGGIGGQYVKPTALANVRKFYELLNKSIDIVGVGGIYSGTDAFEFLLAGASAVQVGTVFMQEGPGCFERIDRELAEILERKGYSSIEDAKGKLKTIE